MRKFFQVSKMLFLSIVLNILIVTTAYFVVTLVCAYLGISLEDSPMMFYLIFYSAIGFGGAFISLQLSRYMAKKVFGIRLLGAVPGSSPEEHKLLQTVERLSRKAGLPQTPEVGIFDSPEVNAFATGPSKSRSLVAVSTGLLSQMNDDELEGVLAHEVSHIANGDMVTMAVIQGLVNTMVLILARIAVAVISAQMRRRSFWMEYMLFIAFQMIFNLLGSILVVNVFSRWREYKADKGAAELSGKSKIIQALKRLQDVMDQARFDSATARYNAFKISTQEKKSSFFSQMLSTHPPLALRIQAIEKMKGF